MADRRLYYASRFPPHFNRGRFNALPYWQGHNGNCESTFKKPGKKTRDVFPMLGDGEDMVLHRLCFDINGDAGLESQKYLQRISNVCAPSLLL